MKIKSVAVYSDASRNVLLEKTAVMVDALRASATIITALANGADRIVPTGEPNEAVAIKKISEGSVLLCGEIAAQKVSGFDLGNSPLEYTRDAVSERILIYSTTNGSVAVKALNAADEVLVGTFINAQAVAKKAYAGERDVVLACAGTKDSFSTDDALAAGCIVDRLLKLDETIETDDFSKVCLRLYRQARPDILAALEGCSHVEYLRQLKMYDDLEYCTREDMFDLVPVYKEGIIVAE